MQIKELEANGVKPQDSKIDTGMGNKRKVLTSWLFNTCLDFIELLQKKCLKFLQVGVLFNCFH